MHAREVIHLRMRVGTTDREWSMALRVGRRFASEHIDRRARDYVVYSTDDPADPAYVVWWTRARAVVVYQQGGEPVDGAA